MISIIPYQSNWPTQFEQLSRTLHEALGDLALRIDHIGSTAVSGLAAKNIIDIQITTTALTTELENALNKIGYQRILSVTKDHTPAGTREAPEEWIKWFFTAPNNQCSANIHVRLAGRANQRYSLLFRDFLRAHPQVATAYGQTQQALTLSAVLTPIVDPIVQTIFS